VLVLKIPLLSAAGTLAATVPGSIWWIAPAVGFALTVVYEHTTPPEERHALLRPGAGRYLITEGPQMARDAGAALSGGVRALSAPRTSRKHLTEPNTDNPATSREPAAPAAARSQQQGAARKQSQVRERPRWVEIVNDEPDKHPHALILGGTGAGKTTMAKAIIGDRGGRAVVLAPKVSPKGWVGSGAEIITLDDDCTYAPIVRALEDIDEEKRRRSRLVKLGKTPEPLTIVLDDIQDLAVKEPAAGELMVNLSSIGRELNMRLIGIGTTDDALNIRGWKASRNNYVRIETDSTRRGVLNDGVRTINIHAQESKRLADAARLQPWRGEVEQLPLPDPAPARRAVAADAPRPATATARVPAQRTAADLDFLLDGLLAQEVPEPARKASLDERIAAALQGSDAPPDAPQHTLTVEGGAGRTTVNVYPAPATVVPVPVEATPMVGRTRRRQPSRVNAKRLRERAEKYQQVKQLVAENKSGNEIDDLVPGERKKILRLVRQAKAELGK
jgi:hypothetical protein